MTGEDLDDAQAAFDQRTNEPIVNFRFKTGGARKFGEVTPEQCRPALCHRARQQGASRRRGSASRSSAAPARSAATSPSRPRNDLAILLRAGALPGQADDRRGAHGRPEPRRATSIRAGIIASIVATVAIAVFMIVCYGLLGVFADIALIANNFLMIGILTLLGATLTLPGIAGIVLTMGMAVDANVLIYERMREEAHAGRSTIAAHRHRVQTAFAHHHRLASDRADRRDRAVLAGLGADPRLRRHPGHRHHLARSSPLIS